MDTDMISRSLAIGEVVRRIERSPREMLAAIEEALARIAGDDDIVFYRAESRYVAPEESAQSVKEITSLAEAGKLLADPPYTQSLMVLHQDRGQQWITDFTERLAGIDSKQAMVYQLLGMQMMIVYGMR
jgi:hypothetical protein